MAAPGEQIERLIAQRYATAEDLNKHAAILGALGQLSPHNDDGQQGYVTLLQRLQAAIAVELTRLAALPPSR